MARSSALLAVTVLGLLSGCAGPPIPAPIEGEPVCPDFESGHTMMVGGLKYPVRLRVLSGKKPIFRIVLNGRRHPSDPPTHTFIADDNETYTLEWAQCANERAPRSVAAATHEKKGHETPASREAAGYECGDATVYATSTLVTRKGDRASHTIKFATPPNAACLEAAPPPPKAVLDAGVEAGGDAGPDAGGDGDGGSPIDAGLPDAAATNPGATDAGRPAKR